MENYSAIKRNILLIHLINQMYPTCTLLSERSQTPPKKTAYFITSFIGQSEKAKKLSGENQWFPGSRGPHREGEDNGTVWDALGGKDMTLCTYQNPQNCTPQTENCYVMFLKINEVSGDLRIKWRLQKRNATLCKWMTLLHRSGGQGEADLNNFGTQNSNTIS